MSTDKSKQLDGTLTRWNNERGFGFVKASTGVYFLHVTQVMEGEPVVGAQVKFFAGQREQAGKNPAAFEATIEAPVAEVQK